MIFNSIDIGIDIVVFQYIMQGQTKYSEVYRPDGISYSQWTDFWRSINGGIEELEDEIEKMQTELSEVAKSEYDRGVQDGMEECEREIDDFEREIDDLEDEIFRLEGDINSLEELVKLARDNQ